MLEFERREQKRRRTIAAPVSLVDSAIVRLLPAVPKPVVRRISERYIAGDELDDALRVVRRLNDEGKLATIDVLGEEIADPDEARAIADAYREAIEAFERGRLDSNVSVKPTALGLKLGYDLCRENLRGRRAARRRARQLRPDRHGGLVDDRRHAARSTASCARPATTTSASSCRRG